MKIFVTGVCGQLGYDVAQELVRRNIEIVGSDIHSEFSMSGVTYCQLDITDWDSVKHVLENEKPDAVIHCAGWTAVDAAEENADQVFLVNATGTEYLAKACAKLNCKLMYISTDYVFDGLGGTPWDPDFDRFAPLNVYGASKRKGEENVQRFVEKFFIVRIAWAFGIHGNNFVKTMLNLGRKVAELRVVNDQIGTPTYTFDLAILLADMIQTERYGFYHATNEGGYISWYDFACEIFRQTGYTTKVIPVTSDEYGKSKAKRPYNSRLSKDKLVQNGFELLPSWQDALKRYLKAIHEIN